jgi:hypothetical protein
MPKSLKKVFEETYFPDKKYTYSNFIIELENDKKHSTVYLKTKDKTIKLLRFKGELSKKKSRFWRLYVCKRYRILYSIKYFNLCISMFKIVKLSALKQ